MLCFVSAYSLDIALNKVIMASDKLRLFSKENRPSKDGSARLKYIYSWYNLKFEFHVKKIGEETLPYRLIMSGSLHKFHNSGTNEPNQFTYDSFLKVVSELKSIGVELEQFVPTQLEFGITFRPNRPVKEVVESFLYYKRTPFTVYSANYYCRRSISQNSRRNDQHFQLKVYDKGEQCNRPSANLLRLEARINRSSHLKSIEIYNLSDLCSVKMWKTLINHFERTLNHCIILDNEFCEEMGEYKGLRLDNPLSWGSYKKDGKHVFRYAKRLLKERTYSRKGHLWPHIISSIRMGFAGVF